MRNIACALLLAWAKYWVCFKVNFAKYWMCFKVNLGEILGVV